MTLTVDETLHLQLNEFAEQCRKSVACDTCIVIVSASGDYDSHGTCAAGLAGGPRFKDNNDFLVEASMDMLRSAQQVLQMVMPDLRLVLRTPKGDIEIKVNQPLAVLLNEAGGLDPSDQDLLDDFQQRQSEK